jgi:hypothetical protein
LGAALIALEADGVLTSALGEPLVRWFCAVKRAELARLDEVLKGDQKGHLGPVRARDEEAEALRVSAAWRSLFAEFT